MWNSTGNVQCRRETIRVHFESETSIHNQAVASVAQHKVSYFVKEKNKEDELKDVVYEKVFRALYWLAKEEITNTKISSLLQLLEKMGVDEVKCFQTRSEPVLREMLMCLSSIIVEDVVLKIKNSKCYGLLTDEVTDISNMCQLVTFIKYFDYEIGNTSTKFVDSSDLLEKSEEASPNADAVVNCLVAMLNQLDLELSDLKAFSSDGASVMTGVDGAVAAKLRRMDDCKTMINVHCICHRLALACSDMDDELQFVKDFELTMIQLWKFFKDSPKRVRTYIRVAMQSKKL